jgi:hypothetical protein
VPDELSGISPLLQSAAVALKREVLRNDITDVLFDESATPRWYDDLVSEALILCAEGVLERQVEQSLQLSEAEAKSFAAGAGIPVAWFSPDNALKEHPLWSVIREQWRYLRDELAIGSNDSECLVAGASPRDDATLRRVVLGESFDCARRYALPPVGWLEKMSRMVERHPFDIAMFCIKAADECPEMRRVLTGDWVQRQVIRDLLASVGHQWWGSAPRQATCARSMVSFADVEVLAQKYYDEVEVVYQPPPRKGWVESVLVPWQNKLFFGRSPLRVELGIKGTGRMIHIRDSVVEDA